jgi:sugar-specific transcriptional regulator TrmB
MKKLAVFTIIVLIFGTVSPSLVNHAYAQNDPNILLHIAIQADKQIVNQLDRVYGNQIPNNLKILYDKGHGAVESLNESLPNDIKKAKQDFLLAMNSFMQISRTISQSSEKIIIITKSVKYNRNLSSEIDRLEKYITNLEAISKKYDVNVKSDFIQIHDLIQELRNQTNNGNTNYDDIINKIKLILNSIKNTIQESTSKHKSDFIKRFFDRLLDRIDKQLTKAQDDGIDQFQIDKGHTLILEIRELLSKNQIHDAKLVYGELKELMQNIEYSIRIT